LLEQNVEGAVGMRDREIERGEKERERMCVLNCK
jgi:hypothetical protein